MWEYINTSFVIFFSEKLQMYPIFIVLITWFLVQFVKLFIDAIKSKRFHYKNIFIAWWFPSFHAAFVSSASMLALLSYWFDSIIFGVVAAFSMLICYDAMNVRYQAWQHAQYINTLRGELTNILLSQQKKKPLQERIGHTPLEVFGGILFGGILTFFLYYYFIII